MKSLFAILALITSITSRRCPKIDSLRSDYVKTSFNITKYASNTKFYEIAYKDITQPRFCDCITTTKSIATSNQVKDEFELRCNRHITSTSTSRYNLTGIPGHFTVGWRNLEFPHTIVDIGRSIDEFGVERYDWTIEFACIEKAGIVIFYALMFNSRIDTLDYLEEMKTAARKAGLERFMNGVRKLKIVDHSDCP